MTSNDLKKLRDGDKEVFEKLVRDNQDNVYKLILSIVHNEEDAKDLAQETFIKVYTSISSFNGSSSVSTWIYRIGYNTALDFCRKNKRVPESKSLDDDEDNQVKFVSEHEDKQPENILVKQEMLKDVEAALEKLPEDQRRVIELRDRHGFSYEEICDITGQREGTVKSRINRARKNMKKFLSEKWNI